MADESRRGWGWPLNSQKAHYFIGARSLCMKWMFTGELDQGNDTSIDNCAACKKRLAKLNARLPAKDAKP